MNDDYKLKIVKELVVMGKFFLNNFLSAGHANEKGITINDVCRKQLMMGVKVEMEHTSSPTIAMRIALDHLAEIPDYYTRLEKMEEEAFNTLGTTEDEGLTREELIDLFREMKKQHKDTVDKGENKMFSLMFNLEEMPSNLAKQDNKEIHFLHSEIHSLWQRVSKGEVIKSWDKSTIIRNHVVVVKELLKRTEVHNYLSNLDDTLPADLKKITKGSRESDMQDKRDEIKADDLKKKKEQSEGKTNE